MKKIVLAATLLASASIAGAEELVLSTNSYTALSTVIISTNTFRIRTLTLERGIDANGNSVPADSFVKADLYGGSVRKVCQYDGQEAEDDIRFLNTAELKTTSLNAWVLNKFIALKCISGQVSGKPDLSLQASGQVELVTP